MVQLAREGGSGYRSVAGTMTMAHKNWVKPIYTYIALEVCTCSSVLSGDASHAVSWPAAREHSMCGDWHGKHT